LVFEKLSGEVVTEHIHVDFDHYGLREALLPRHQTGFPPERYGMNFNFTLDFLLSVCYRHVSDYIIG
jgi:hypothetical protein